MDLCVFPLFHILLLALVSVALFEHFYRTVKCHTEWQIFLLFTASASQSSYQTLLDHAPERANLFPVFKLAKVDSDMP